MPNERAKSYITLPSPKKTRRENQLGEKVNQLIK